MNDVNYNLDNFVNQVISKNPLHANFIKLSIEQMSPHRAVKLMGYIAYCKSIGLTIEELVDSYNTITIDTQMEQIYFRKHNKYRWSKFSEVSENVYFDDTYMRKYMYGLALTSFLWPNHAAIHDFFLETLSKTLSGTYLEIGPGHGYYFLEASRICNFDRMIGVDISTSSIAMTRDIVHYYGIDEASRVDFVEADFLTFEPSSASYSCIVMGEVLEHVEEPAKFLCKLADISNNKTHVYITTCINAPAVDHIFLFRNQIDVEQMIEECGFGIKKKLYVPYGRLSLEESILKLLPVNVAYVLEKK